MSDVVLGVLPTGQSERDAIHVAVIPMIAAEMLRPGQRIGLVGDGIAGPSGTITGIVDPYLTDVIPKGAAFWMCLLPGTVTGMRHHWIHPDFNGPVSPVIGDKATSEQWLRQYAKRVNSYDEGDKGFTRLIHGLESRELFFHGSDLHGRYDLDDEEELRIHAEIYLGHQIDFDRFEYSCSC